MNYRPDIDGLRALAVIPVILFHAGFDFFKGGYVGVDIFFVISGYLIASIIIKEVDNGNFTLMDFYERRARRIFPALFMMMLVCLPVAWFWLLPSDFKSFGQSLIAVSTFVSNAFFWFESGYFDTSGEFKPLLHTWTLSLEEQFYIFFPVFMVLFWKLGIRKITIILSLVVLISLVLAHIGTNFISNSKVSSGAFYLLPARCWELLLGAICALHIYKNGFSKKIFLNQALSFIGLLMIVAAILFYSKSTPFPSFYALLPTLGAVFLVLFMTPATLSYKLLTTRFMVLVGLISYSAYLWHQPVLAFARHRSFNDLSASMLLLLCALSLVLAAISWRYVERPFRNRSFLTRSQIGSLSLLFILGFVVIGFFISINNGYPNRTTFQSAYHQGGYNLDNKSLLNESWEILEKKSGDSGYRVDDNPYDLKLWFDLNDNRTKVLMVGNSHSKDFYNVLSFSQTAKENLQIARYGERVRSINKRFFQSPNYVNADVVVISSLNRIQDLKSLERVVKRVVTDGKKIILMKSLFIKIKRENISYIDREILPRIRNESLDEISASLNAKYTDDYNGRVYAAESWKKDAEAESLVINDLVNKYSFTLLDRMDYVCDDGLCHLVSNNLDKYFYDTGHHTLMGAKFFATRVDQLQWVKRYFK